MKMYTIGLGSLDDIMSYGGKSCKGEGGRRVRCLSEEMAKLPSLTTHGLQDHHSIGMG